MLILWKCKSIKNIQKFLQVLIILSNFNLTCFLKIAENDRPLRLQIKRKNKSTWPWFSMMAFKSVSTIVVAHEHCKFRLLFYFIFSRKFFLDFRILIANGRRNMSQYAYCLENNTIKVMIFNVNF